MQDFRLPPDVLVCKCDVLVVTQVITVIIDNSLGVNLMSHKADARIESIAEPLCEWKITLIGASGEELKIDGWFVMGLLNSRSETHLSMICG